MKKSHLARQDSTRTASPPAAFGTGLIALDVILNAATANEPAMVAGGSCGNVLAILSYLGWATFPVARLNGDAASEIVRADLRRWGVSLDFSAQAPATSTPIIVQTIRRDRFGSPVHRFSLVCPMCGAWFPTFRAVTSAAAYGLIDMLASAALPNLKPRVFYFDRVSRGALILAEGFAARGAVVMFEPASIGEPKLFNEALAVAHILKYSHERLPSLAARQLARGSLFLEIETRGSEGLRYRSSLLPSRAWRALAAIRVPQVVDTAGAGDWCTAGLLSRLAVSGVSGLADSRPCDLVAGLRFGQAAAAVACCFGGARGAMYALSETRLSQVIATLLASEAKLTVGRAVKPALVPPEDMAERCPDSREEPKERSPVGRRAARSPSRHSPVSALCPACG